MNCAFKQTILAAGACLLLAGAVRADIIVSEVNSAGSASASGYGGDWFELTNTGVSSVNVTDWRVDDDSAAFGSGRTLTGVSDIAPGESVVFMESPAGSTSNFLTVWFGGSPPSGFQLGTYSGSGIGLGQGGDQVNIYNSLGALQANVSFGAPSGSSTFDNAAGLTGSISLPSAVGVNGAFTSANGEIGSPGTTISVPEPCTALLLMLGAGVLTSSRKFWSRCRA